MDGSMTFVDGYEATRRIRNNVDMFDEQTRSLPIILTNKISPLSVQERYREAGMNDCIIRPVRHSGSREAVLKWASPKQP